MKDAGEGGVLLLCYGNPARLDDGLGPAFGAAVEREALSGVTVETDYQLMVEDAKTAADYRTVLFVDADMKGPGPFFFKPVRPQASLNFSSHSLEPEHVLALAGQLFGRQPAGFALGIRGYQFNDFGEQLTPAARINLNLALQFLLKVLERGDFEQASAALACAANQQAAGNGE
jgi:hydrogenase maturation protease